MLQRVAALCGSPQDSVVHWHVRRRADVSSAEGGRGPGVAPAVVMRRLGGSRASSAPLEPEPYHGGGGGSSQQELHLHVEEEDDGGTTVIVSDADGSGSCAPGGDGRERGGSSSGTAAAAADGAVPLRGLGSAAGARGPTRLGMATQPCTAQVCGSSVCETASGLSALASPLAYAERVRARLELAVPGPGGATGPARPRDGGSGFGGGGECASPSSSATPEAAVQQLDRYLDGHASLKLRAGGCDAAGVWAAAGRLRAPTDLGMKVPLQAHGHRQLVHWVCR
jgi:hypothetical protein